MPSDFYSYIQGKDNKFREIRVIKRIPQEVLERRTKISQTKISQIDNGLAVPTEKEKKKLARALGVSVSEIWPVLRKGKGLLTKTGD